jgi:2-dehydropantoate 2-reductase
MKILILGAGGIGGFFGAHLLRQGADVTFLVRPAREALIRAQGLRVETPTGAFTVQPPTVTADTAAPVYDLVVLAPKAYDLDDALASVQGAVGSARVLPLLNGLDHLDVLDRHFGRARVLGGLAHIAATVTDTGAVRQLGDLQMLTIGVRDGSQQALLEKFAEHCRRAPFKTVVADDVEQALWNKWTFLATLAGMTTLCRGPVGEIVATPHGADVTRRLHDECCAVAAASGHPVGEADRAAALAMLTAPGSTFTASMLRDLLAGHRTEHEHILGSMARRGREHGLAMDLVRLAHTHLAVQAAAARSRG